MTQEWWKERRPDFDLYVSQLVVQEASAGDPDAVSRRQNALKDAQLLALTAEAATLAKLLIERGVIPEQSVEDALHIAIATVNGMDYLVT